MEYLTVKYIQVEVFKICIFLKEKKTLNFANNGWSMNLRFGVMALEVCVSGEGGGVILHNIRVPILFLQEMLWSENAENLLRILVVHDKNFHEYLVFHWIMEQH